MCVCVTSTVDIIHSNLKSSNCLESSVAIGYEQNNFFFENTPKSKFLKNNQNYIYFV